MKNTIFRIYTWIGRLICFHHYEYVMKLSDISALVQCERCERYFGVHFPLRIVLPFDEEMCDMYKRIGVKGLEKYLNKTDAHDKK